jgi:hypothetical protein
MKMRFLFAALVASVALASVALAKDGPRPGRPDAATGNACKPKVAFILKGSFLSGGPSSFQMNITRSNRHGRALRGPREIMVDALTKFRRKGNAATLASLQANDRLNVHVRGCKRADARAMELLAKRVVARAQAAPG